MKDNIRRYAVAWAMPTLTSPPTGALSDGESFYNKGPKSVQFYLAYLQFLHEHCSQLFRGHPEPVSDCIQFDFQDLRGLCLRPFCGMCHWEQRYSWLSPHTVGTQDSDRLPHPDCIWVSCRAWSSQSPPIRGAGYQAVNLSSTIKGSLPSIGKFPYLIISRNPFPLPVPSLKRAYKPPTPGRGPE